MNATEYIKNSVTIVQILNFYGVKYQNNRCACPLHHGNNTTAFVFNTDNNLYYCHTHCGGGDIFRFVEIKESISFIESVKLIASNFDIDISEMSIQERTIDIDKELQKWIQTMRYLISKTEVKEYDILQLGKLHPINQYRQFGKEILNEFQIKYCSENSRIVVPISYNKICVGVTMRATKNHPAKWLHQPSGIQTGNFLFNYDNIKKGEPLILVESIWDTLNYYQYGYTNVVGSFGCSLSKEQTKLILQNTYDLIIAYDNDSAGISGKEKVIGSLKNIINIKQAVIPIGKDPGELTKEEIENSLKDIL